MKVHNFISTAILIMLFAVTPVKAQGGTCATFTLKIIGGANARFQTDFVDCNGSIRSETFLLGESKVSAERIKIYGTQGGILLDAAIPNGAIITCDFLSRQSCQITK